MTGEQLPLIKHWVEQEVDMADRLLTTRELQDLLQLDRVTIYRMVKEGELPALCAWAASGASRVRPSTAGWPGSRASRRPSQTPTNHA